MTKPTLNIVLFNLQQITRDKVLPQMVDVIQSLSEFGINVGLVSDKNRGETKALLETYHKSLFDLFDSIVYSKSHLEMNSFEEVINNIDDEFPPLLDESLIINPTIKDGTQFTPVKYVIINPSNFNADFGKTLKEFIGEEFSFRNQSNIELEEVIKAPEVVVETKEEVIAEEIKDESVSV